MAGLECSVSLFSLKRRNQARFASETKNPAILDRKVAQKRGIQQERVIPIVVHIFLLKRHPGIMIVVKDSMAGFEDRVGLPMNSRRIEKESRTRLPGDVRNSRSVERFDFAIFPQPFILARSAPL
jgi:hypothetical protein